MVAHLRGRCGQHGRRQQDHPEGVSDEGGEAGTAGAEVLAAFSEPLTVTHDGSQRRDLAPGQVAGYGLWDGQEMVTVSRMSAWALGPLRKRSPGRRGWWAGQEH